ncbi:D-alanyl-D-alanine carboxypeptidase family protein [Megalodesulfovibrio paquesii]
MTRRLIQAILLLCIVLAAATQAAAESWLVYEPARQAMLLESRADERRAPASLVKCMTALLVCEAVANGTFAMTDLVAAPPEVAHATGARLGLVPGQTLSVSELLTAMLLGSANDAALALAAHLAPHAGGVPAFVEVMNAKAAALGLANTRFATPHGLPAPNQYSTARDLAILTANILATHPQLLAITSERTAIVLGRTLHNRNELLGLPGVDGLKTGSTAAAGACIIVTARREGRRLIVVLLGAADPATRAQRAAALLEQGFAVAP